MPTTKKTWMGSKPETCDICSKPLKQQFVDGRTVYGYWALMCVHCHRIIGCGLGTGNGQRYDLTTLEKVDG